MTEEVEVTSPADMEEQRRLERKFQRAITGKSFINAMAALETVIGNTICDTIRDEDKALECLEEIKGDIADVIRARFAARRAAH